MLDFQEKETDGAEGSFAQDFKTLGDVLIQEMVRNDLAKTYPNLADHIQVGWKFDMSCLRMILYVVCDNLVFEDLTRSDTCGRSVSACCGHYC